MEHPPDYPENSNLNQHIQVCVEKKLMFTKSVGYYSRGHGQAPITHTQIRIGLSPLKHQLYSYGIVDSPNCTLCTSGEDETQIHYFMKCTKHVASRHELLQKLRPTVTDDCGQTRHEHKHYN